MAQDLGALTNTWMLNPYMFDPSQQSNQFSNYNNAALPYPPTYNTGAGGPVNAATGQPIQSFQQWQAQNPGGMSLNNTPAQPGPPNQTALAGPSNVLGQALGMTGGGYNQTGSATGSPSFNAAANQAFATGDNAYLSRLGYGPGGSVRPGSQAAQYGGPGATGGPAATPQGAGGAPNNWMAALNALANPGKVQTMGANVPQVTGSQPAGGVNQAFLNQVGAGQGMNQNFLSALRAIQSR